MLISDLSLVRAAHIVLASASPRRTAILNEQFGLNVRAIPSTFEETLDKNAFDSPVDYAMENARQKALEVFSRCESPFGSKHDRPPSLIVGADTIVILNGQILEKPKSTDDARRMLSALSDAGSHTVCTAVALVYGGSCWESMPHEHTFAETTTVAFKPINQAEIEAYVATGEPMDKAGGYGIQGMGGAFVTSIVGDYQNVVGFPAARFCAELDAERLAHWIDAAPAEPVSKSVPVTSGYTIVSDECDDLDECGLPSD
jgi:septum formation protein